MPRPGPQFSFDQMANSLRSQASMAELQRRFTAAGDVVPWAAPMGSSGTAPTGFAGLAGFYIRVKDLVFASFAATFGGSVGTGNYIVPVPVSVYSGGGSLTGAWVATRGTNETDGRIMRQALTYRTGNPGTIINVGPTAPLAWTAGDTLEGWMMYLAAKSA